MRTNSELNRSKKSYRGNFLILPIVFLLIGYILFFVCLTPVIDPLVSVYKLAFSNANASSAVDGTGTNSIFNGSTGVHSGLLTTDDFEFPTWGKLFGSIKVDNTEIDCDLIFGDSKDLLKKGACMSMESRIPGCGSGVLVGAHNNTYFHTLPDAQVGDLVHLETNYGSFVYRIYETKIIDTSKSGHADEYFPELYGDKEILLLYTCWPINTLASTPNRYFAFCEFVSGPQVNIYETGREMNENG